MQAFSAPLHPLARLPRLESTSPASAPTSLLIAVAAVALSSLAAVFALTASGSSEDTLGRATMHILVVGAPVAAGLFAVRSRRSERFGRMLILAGFVWSLGVLAEAPSSLAYSTGRVVTWFIFPLLVYLMLAFPAGRIALRRDRLLFAGVTAVVVVLYIGSALISEAYPRHSPWASCDASCPANAFLVLDSEPAFVGDVLAPVRDLLSVLLLIGVSVVLAARLRSVDTLHRVTIGPVLAVSSAATLVLVAFIVARRVAPDASAADALGLAWALCLPAIALAFSVGLLRRRLFLGNALSALSASLKASDEPRRLGASLRDALEGSDVDVLLRDRPRDRWVHDDGRVAEPPNTTGDERVLREIVDDTGPVAALVVDADLEDEHELVDAIVALADASLRESGLRAKLEHSLVDLEDSRKRIATAADVERRRIERDLHDGAQQRLIALRMRLSLAEDLLGEDPAAARAAVHDLGEDVDVALDEIRSLAHGIYPALLADRGLEDALRSAARRSPLPVRIRAATVGRLPPQVESALYFTCLEALQNAVKHARGATGVTIVMRRGVALEFAVTDDGAGFTPGKDPAGAGLRNMRDRMESVGGTLTVRSAPGRGTTVRGTVPVARRA